MEGRSAVPASRTTGRVRRLGCELAVLTGTRLRPDRDGAPHSTRSAGLGVAAPEAPPSYCVVSFRSEKSATVSSSVQSPTLPFEKRSSLN